MNGIIDQIRKTAVEAVPYIDRRELGFRLGQTVIARIVGDGSAATVVLPDNIVPSLIVVTGETLSSSLIAPADRGATGDYQSTGNSAAAIVTTAGVSVVTVTVAAADVANTDIGLVTCSLD
jgi:hypothetical protein